MLTMRKALITACATALISGCGGDSSVSSTAEPGFNIDQPALDFQAGTYPEFNPAASQLPTNNDLLFLGAAAAQGADYDGTADVGFPTNPAEDAINDLDGFSTSAYFHVKFGGGSINPATICTNLGGCPGPLPPNVFLLPLITETGGDPLDPSDLDTDGSEGGPFDQANIPAISAEVVSLDGGTDNALRIIPEETLLPATKYLVVVTDIVQDANGDPITQSFHYNLLSDPSAEVGSALQSVQTILTQVWNPLANGFLAQNPGDPNDDIPGNVAISYTFTTTDPTAPLTAMAAPRAALTQALAEQGAPNPMATASGLEAGGFIDTPKPRDLGIAPSTGVDLNTLTQGQVSSGRASLYTGYIKLPYYLTAPDSQGAIAGNSQAFWGQEFWRGNESLNAQLGDLAPTDTDGTLNVTYRYPFAGEKSVESFPLQVILPDPTHAPAALGGTTCAQVQAGNGGYAVALYIHGITSDRTSAIGLGHTLADNACIATVAIDLPVHGVAAINSFAGVLNMDRGDPDLGGPATGWSDVYGADTPRERHFEVVQDASGNPAPMNFSSPTAQDGSGAWFINLGTLQNTRDNLRQAVMDLLNLNASLETISQLDLDGDMNDDLNLGAINVVGVSLGAIVGDVFAATNGAAIMADAGAGFSSNLNPIQGAVLSVGGSQLTQVLINSDTFRPRINAGLASNGVLDGTSDYESFIFAAQSTVASGDPVNFAESLAAQGLPVLFQQVVDDAVVPNTASVTGAPLAGTEAFAQLGGATQVGAGMNYDFSSGEDGPALVVIDDLSANGAQHSSLLTPAEGTADALSITSEMQSHVVQFVGSNGTDVSIGGFAPGAIVAP
jgi:hypothetical protein